MWYINSNTSNVGRRVDIFSSMSLGSAAAEDDVSSSTDVSGESQFVTTDFSSPPDFVDQNEVEKLSQKKKEKVMSGE